MTLRPFCGCFCIDATLCHSWPLPSLDQRFWPAAATIAPFQLLRNISATFRAKCRQQCSSSSAVLPQSAGLPAGRRLQSPLLLMALPAQPSGVLIHLAISCSGRRGDCSKRAYHPAAGQQSGSSRCCTRPIQQQKEHSHSTLVVLQLSESSSSPDALPDG